MALIGKIRNNMWFVLVLLGLALAAFIIMDMTSSQNIGAGASPIIGSVEGQEINWNEFQTTEKLLYSGSQADIYSKREGIWNYFLEKKLLEKEAENLGIGIGPSELSELQFGQNLSPVVQNRFINPQTGQVDRPQLNQIKTLIDNNELNREAHLYWYEVQKEIVKYELQNKLGNIVNKSVYTPTWMAEMRSTETSSSVDFNFVKIPFDQVDAEEVSVSDSDLKAYIDDNKKLYTAKEERRIAEFIVFDVFPTDLDSTALFAELKAISDEFQLKSVEDDSIYAIGNNGSFVNFYYKAENLGDAIEGPVSELNVREVYGPYEDSGNYLSIKLIDKKVIPDSVEARHILRNADPNNIIAMNAANDYIDSLMNLVKKGVEDFDSLAMKNSNDPVSAAKGGDLGYFAQGAMVQEFNQAMFFDGKEGDLIKITTQFGVHLVEITDQVFENRDPKYKVAFIRIPITPSQRTQDSIMASVNDLIADNRDLTTLKEQVASNSEIQIEKSDALKENDYRFSNLGTGQSSRDIIQWLFGPATEVDEVAPNAFTYSDPVNYFDSKYVIVGLTSIEEAGLSSVDAVRSNITPLVMNLKKGELLASKINATDLESLASEYGTTVETVFNATLASPYVPQLGNEPKVLASAFNTTVNELSTPIVGNSGVFVIQPVNKSDAPSTINIPEVKASISSLMQSQIGRGLLESIKENAKIKDNRSAFY